MHGRTQSYTDSVTLDMGRCFWFRCFAAQVISMSPEPTGHARYPICSCEGSWAPNQTVGLDRVPTSLDGGFLLSESVNVFSRIPTFSCQRMRLKEPGIENDRKFPQKSDRNPSARNRPDLDEKRSFSSRIRPIPSEFLYGIRRFRDGSDDWNVRPWNEREICFV